MSKRAKIRAFEVYPENMQYSTVYDCVYDLAQIERKKFLKVYEQAEKDTIERAVAWLEETFFDNSHHSGRGSYGQIETNDFDSMEEMIEKFKKAMEEEK